MISCGLGVVRNGAEFHVSCHAHGRLGSFTLPRPSTDQVVTLPPIPERMFREHLAELGTTVEGAEIQRRQREHVDSLILSATRAIETARNEAVALGGGNENMVEALRCAAELTRLAGKLG